MAADMHASRVARREPGTPAVPASRHADHGQRLIHALPQRAGRAGMGVVELAGEAGELLERAGSIRALTWGAVALGEMPEHVSLSLKARCCQRLLGGRPPFRSAVRLVLSSLSALACAHRVGRSYPGFSIP